MTFQVPPYKFVKFISSSQNWGFDKFQIQNFWKFSKGKGVRICVLDSGMPDHIDLVINNKLSKNFISHEDFNDKAGHATSVIGLLNAQFNFFNAEGICPEAEIICLKVLDHMGGGDERDIMDALEYAFFLNPDIINLSFGTSDPLTPEFEQILQKIRDAGIFVVCASGNRGVEKLDYPACSPNCIAVGSIDEMFQHPEYSTYGDGLDFVMPGKNIYTTCGKNSYCYVTGTSFSCPFFSGVLALYLGYLKKNKFPYTYEYVVNELYRCALDLGEVGPDKVYGYGSINLNCLFNIPKTEKKPSIWKRFLAKLKFWK